MSDKSDTWMPFYVGDYLAATGRLTTEQHGAYLLILLDYWKNGPPPNDDAVLAQISRLSMPAWRKAKPALLGYFEIRDGKLIQKRVEKERVRAIDLTEKRSKAGKASAEARAKAKADGNKRSTHVATHDPSNGQHNARPSPSPICSDEQIISPNGDSSAEPTDAPHDYEPPLTVKEIVDGWNARMVPQGFPAVQRLIGTRERHLKARIRENTLDDFQRAMAALERSAFCRGENDRGWRADFDFFVQPKSFTKLLEGAYDH